MARWLLLPLALLVAVAAGWLLLIAPEAGPVRSTPPVASPGSRASSPAPAKSQAKKPGKPMGHIDEASRRELERVLEDEGLGR